MDMGPCFDMFSIMTRRRENCKGDSMENEGAPEEPRFFRGAFAGEDKE